MDNKDIAREWFTIAARDFAAAEYLKNMHPVPIDIICYHCQQSVEKYLTRIFHKKHRFYYQILYLLIKLKVALITPGFSAFLKMQSIFW
jgi:HEPN domain-containing protein